MNIIIVEDEPSILELIVEILEDAGYNPFPYSDAESLIENIDNLSPNLFLLDLMLPGMSGLELCKVLKNKQSIQDVPIIFTTARAEDFDVITGFDTGCDDYITKPFNRKILLARINSVLSRCKSTFNSNDSIIKYKNLMIDESRYEVSIKGRLIKLTVLEFQILQKLVKNKGQVFTREQLMDVDKNAYDIPGERAIDCSISRIRKKIGVYGNCIETLYGLGYKFE